MARKTKAQIEFSVVTEGFDAGIKKMNAGLKTTNKELRLNAEQMKGASDASGLLQDRQQLLKNGLAASREKITLINKELQTAEQLLGKNSKEYHTLSNSLISAKTEQQKIINELQRVNDKIAENSRKTQEQEAENRSLARSYKGLLDEIEQHKVKMQGLKEEYQGVILKTSKNSQEAKALEKEIKELSKSLNKNESELKKVENAANEVSGELDDAGDSALGFADVLKANVLGGAILEGVKGLASGIKDISGNLVGLGIDSQKSLNTFAAKTGAAGKELEGMDEAIKDIYKNNFGESLEEIAGDMATVKQVTGQTGEELKKSTRNAMLLSDTFDYDVSESIRSAETLQKQFGLTSDEAFNLIAQGAQNGLDFSGELLDSINEYSVQFEKAGFDAEGMFAILESGTEAGAFNLDKIGDAVKEFSIRAIDGSDTTAEGFKLIGLSADEMAAKFAKGGDSAKEVFQKTIDGLDSIEDPVQRNIAGVDLFGTMWEDLGPEVVTSLSVTNSEIDKTKKTMENLNQVKYDDLGSAITGIKRNIETDVLEPIEDRLFPALSDLATNTDFSKFGDAAVKGIEGIMDAVEFVVEHKDAFVPLAAGIAGVAGAATAASVGMGIYNGVMDIIALKTGAAAVATTGLGAAFTLLTSPMTLVVLGIGAVIGIGVALYQNWDTIKEKAGQLKEVVVEKVTALKEGAVQKFTEAKDKVVETAENLKTAAAEKIEGLRSSATQKFENLKTDASQKWAGMKENVVGKAQEMWNNATSRFEGIRSSASEKFSGARELMTNLMEQARSNVSQKLQNMKNSYDEAGGGIKGIVAGAMTGVKDHFSTYMSMADSITGGKLSSIKGAFEEKMNGAKTIVKGAIEKIKGFFNFSWKLPDIKVPSFSVTGGKAPWGFMGKGSLPKVSVTWHAKGGLFTGPTIIPANGFGEAGHEYALPLNRTTLRPLAEMLGSMIIKDKAMQTIDYKRLDKIIEKHSKKETIVQMSRRELLRILEV